MARVRCTCGVLLSLPQGVSTARCPRCYATIVCPSDDGYYLPAANQYNNGYYHHQPPRPLPQLSPISMHGKKRAVLIGISYQGQPNSVKGSVNDVRFMTHFLVNRLGFPNESLLVLTGISLALSFSLSADFILNMFPMCIRASWLLNSIVSC